MIRILIAAINFFSERRDKSTLLEGVEEKIEDITNKLVCGFGSVNQR